ncbi:MAG: class I SAM-dependent methyltransferase [Chloroflexi bacterium]|nr:class I SAM-dependent methyltransferase [Chloroflexota bacterium]
MSKRQGDWRQRLYGWATHRLYHQWAWAYDPVSWCVSLGRWNGWRLDALEHVGGQRVLELGFGTGELLLEMARRGWPTVGIDPSLAMQRLTARKADRRRLAPPRVCAAAQALPFAAGLFDAVVATFPAEYIVERATLREAARVLRPPDPASGAPGGRLVMAGLYVRLHHPLVRWLGRAALGKSEGFSLEQYGEALAQCGLQLRVIADEVGWVRAPLFVAERVALQREGEE